MAMLATMEHINRSRTQARNSTRPVTTMLHVSTKPN
jgi:hypothetical protein